MSMAANAGILKFCWKARTSVKPPRRTICIRFNLFVLPLLCSGWRKGLRFSATVGKHIEIKRAPFESTSQLFAYSSAVQPRCHFEKRWSRGLHKRSVLTIIRFLLRLSFSLRLSYRWNRTLPSSTLAKLLQKNTHTRASAEVLAEARRFVH